MPTLLEAADAFSKLGKKSLEAHEAFCVRVRHRLASCDNCLRVCSYGAITIENNAIAVDNNLCTGCGACTSACPTEALVLVDDVVEAVCAAIDNAREGQALTISCDYLRNSQATDSATGEREMEDGTTTVSVPCLAALDESVIVRAACQGVKLSYQSAICADCPNAEQSLIEDIIGQAEHFLGSVNSFGNKALDSSVSWEQLAFHEHGEHKDLSPEMSRRGMFDHFVARTTDSVAEATVGTLYVSQASQAKEPTLAEKLMAEKGVLKTTEVERNTRVLNDLYRFDPSLADLTSGEDERVLPTRLFGEIELDTETCNLCGICMTLCPTKAIAGEKAEPANSFFSGGYDTNQRGELTFRANDCVACHLCVDICPRKALSLHYGIASDHLFALEPETLLKRP